MSAPLVLRAEDLGRRYGDVQAVTSISLSLARGEPVALMGPSGCGKTSLLQMIGLLDRPTTGRVYLDDVDGWALDAGQRASLRLSHIGFVFQQNNLLPHLSALENIALPSWRLSGDKRAALHAASSLIERVGLQHRRDTRADLLSTGESQRVALARAVVNRPRLVLADEPTGSLDATSSNAVLSTLEELCASGTALLLITHDAAIAQRAQRILRMRAGALEA